MNANWFSFEISSSDHAPYTTSYLYGTPLQPQPLLHPPFGLTQFLPAPVSRCNALFCTIRKALCITSLFSRCSKKWSQSLWSFLFILLFNIYFLPSKYHFWLFFGYDLEMRYCFDLTEEYPYDNSVINPTEFSFYIYISWNTRRCSGLKIKWKNSSD
jgi:hypothetical protein